MNIECRLLRYFHRPCLNQRLRKTAREFPSRLRARGYMPNLERNSSLLFRPLSTFPQRAEPHAERMLTPVRAKVPWLPLRAYQRTAQEFRGLHQVALVLILRALVPPARRRSKGAERSYRLGEGVMMIARTVSRLSTVHMHNPPHIEFNNGRYKLSVVIS